MKAIPCPKCGSQPAITHTASEYLHNIYCPHYCRVIPPRDALNLWGQVIVYEGRADDITLIRAWNRAVGE